ncbi:MAG: riboflavin synthase [Alphaproteobacteria bacterium]|nr:riboflavin synthase [Alphaproteobacteria bacterium]
MFTGIITDVGIVERVDEAGNLRHLRIACAYPAESLMPGQSIACGGPCLTVVRCGVSGAKSWFDVDIGAETLARTTARRWHAGTRLNLERALKIGDELGGHIVTGHIDATARIRAVADFDGLRKIEVEVPPDLARFIAEKGSIALDGTSLTVNGVSVRSLSVLLIPHTIKVTTWGERQVGDELNLEVDLMARYAARLTQAGWEEAREKSL